MKKIENLEMKILDASFTFDRNQLLFNFIFAVIVILPILIALIAFRWFYVIIPIIISVLILISLIIGALVILNTVGKKLYQKLSKKYEGKELELKIKQMHKNKKDLKEEDIVFTTVPLFCPSTV